MSNSKKPQLFHFYRRIEKDTNLPTSLISEMIKTLKLNYDTYDFVTQDDIQFITDRIKEHIEEQKKEETQKPEYQLQMVGTRFNPTLNKYEVFSLSLNESEFALLSKLNNHGAFSTIAKAEIEYHIQEYHNRILKDVKFRKNHD